MNTFRPNPNLEHLLAIATRLTPLLDEIAFVGGCVTELLLTDPAAAPVRPTLDVDAIIAISSYAELVHVEKRLREMGFSQPQTEGSPVCRSVIENLILDLMPTDSSILGFSNRWYRAALENSIRRRIGDYDIRIVTAPYFLAMKLDAFHGRGRNDFRMSHDLEDIVTVIDGRSEVVGEVHLASADLQKYLSDEFRALLSSHDFQEAVPGHLLPDTASQQRLSLVLNCMQKLVSEP